jgi:hypothetical protein
VLAFYDLHFSIFLFIFFRLLILVLSLSIARSLVPKRKFNKFSMYGRANNNNNNNQPDMHFFFVVRCVLRGEEKNYSYQLK